MKIGIAHASKGGARAVQHALSQDASHQVVWTTSNGEDALAKVEQLRPDLLLLDVGLEDPGSLEITRRALNIGPLAILLLADRPAQHMVRVYEAMALGALDVVQCPVLDGKNRISGHELLFAKLRTVIRLLGHSQLSMPISHAGHKLVAIGASTGGPQAIFQILSALPNTLRASIVIVQHVESEFSAGFASWLQQGTTMRLVLAQPGSRPEPGTILLAATNEHLVMTAQRTFTYTSEPKDIPYRPSVDALFGSLADHWSDPGIAVLLTGMGRDGAKGMKRLQQAGWHTVAQDEGSSVVFGMPKAAIELNAANEVVALSGIARAVTRAVSRVGTSG